ncbi:MAG: pilus assembly FimT family protein [Planctomycetota bacterium]
MQKGGTGFISAKQIGRRKALTLIEALIVVSLIGILAVIAVPRLNTAVISRYKAEVAAKKIVTDLRRVRGLAISNAVNNTQGFELRLLGPDPYTGYEIVNLYTTATVDSHTIDPEVAVTGTANEFDFGPLGNLTSIYTQITVSAEGITFTITIIRATGTIKCIES